MSTNDRYTSEASLRASLAAHVKWGLVNDRTSATQQMRDARWAKYLEKVDAIGEFPPEERIRRAQSLRKADMQRMALASIRARKARRLGVSVEELDAAGSTGDEAA